jgi:hypothetical protein
MGGATRLVPTRAGAGRVNAVLHEACVWGVWAIGSVRLGEVGAAALGDDGRRTITCGVCGHDVEVTGWLPEGELCRFCGARTQIPPSDEARDG